MQKAAILAVLVLLPAVQYGFSQSDTESSLGVVFSNFSQHHYKTEDGRTAVVGEVRNMKDFPVTGVRIWAGFYDETGRFPLESATGGTLLEVIPPRGVSPYVIHSSPNPDIADVTVNLLGFNSAGPKSTELVLEERELGVTDRISYRGAVTNTAGIAAENTRVHLAIHDAFEPPRILAVLTAELGSVQSGEAAEFSFDVRYSPQVTGLYVMAESDNLLADTLTADIIPPELITKKITIRDVTVNDPGGDELDGVMAGEPVAIRADLAITSRDGSYEQDYVYYAQVKQSGAKAYIEHLGHVRGSFDGQGAESPEVRWIPEDPGLYFVETFVWDPHGVPLAPKGPVELILVR